MSIINEALKKTEEHLQKNSARNTPAPAIAVRTNRKTFLLYILILLAGLLIANLIFNLLKNKIQTVPAPVINIPPVIHKIDLPPTPVALTPTPVVEKINFVLNGIFFSDNDGYALVNNQIVRENDYVDGAKVGLITATTIELDNAGEKIILTTHR